MSCADTCVVMDYDGGSEFYREVTRRAAKAHKCCECGEVIAVGESHQYATGKSEGEIFSARTCASCQEIRATFACDSWVFGMLWDSINEQVFAYWDEMTAIDCLARLSTDAAVAKMRARQAWYAEGQS